MLKITSLQDAVVDEREHKAVRKARTELFHEIKRQRGSAGAVAVQKTDVRVESHSLQRGGAVVREQAVCKREQRVDIVQRRPPASRPEVKIRLVLQDHFIKHIKICLCANALAAAQRLHGEFLGNDRIECLDLVDRSLKPLDIDPERVVPLCALNAPARVVELAEDHVARDAAAVRRIVRRAVLHAPQKHVPVFLADAPGKEASGRRTEAQAHAASGAASHQRRRRARVAK